MAAASKKLDWIFLVPIVSAASSDEAGSDRVMLMVLIVLITLVTLAMVAMMLMMMLSKSQVF